MADPALEPNDNHQYNAIWLRPRTVALIQKGSRGTKHYWKTISLL